jgi:hypothetical protein
VEKPWNKILNLPVDCKYMMTLWTLISSPSSVKLGLNGLEGDLKLEEDVI